MQIPGLSTKDVRLPEADETKIQSTLARAIKRPYQMRLAISF